MAYKDSKTCRLCYRSEPAIRIAKRNGKPREHNACTECWTNLTKGRLQLERSITGHGYEALAAINLGRLRGLSLGAYRLTYGIELTGQRYEGGCIVLRSDYVWVYTYEGCYQWPAPYALERIAKHLAHLHLFVSSEPFPTLTDAERSRLEGNTPITVFGLA